MKYEVVCSDNNDHVTDGFDSFDSAQYWANWGHCCTNNHLVRIEGAQSGVKVSS